MIVSAQESIRSFDSAYPSVADIVAEFLRFSTHFDERVTNNKVPNC